MNETRRESGFEKIKKSLEKRTQLRQLLFDRCPNGILIETIYGEIVECNDSACRIYGYDKDEIVGLKVADIIPDEFVDGIPEVVSEEQTTKGNFTQAFGKRKDGTIFPIVISSKIGIIDEMPLVVVYVYDTNRRKLAEDELQESRQKYKELANSLPQTVFEMDLDGKMVFANEYAFEVFGYTHEEFDQGIYAIQMIAPDEREKAMISIQSALMGQDIDHEYTMLRKDGTTFPALTYSSAMVRDGKPVGLRGIVVDISSTKEAEKEILQQRNILRQLIDNLPDQIFIKDLESRFITANAEILKGFGLNSVEGIVGKTDSDFLPPKDAKQLYDEEQGIMRTGLGYVNHEYSFQDSSGAKRWYSSIKLPLKDTNGKVIGLVGSNRDISQTRTVEESLHESEEILRVIFDSVNDAILVHDGKGKVYNVNKRMLDIYGISEGEALKYSIVDYSDVSNPLDQLPVIWHKTLSGIDQLFEWKAKRPTDGTTFDVEVFLTKLNLKEKDYILASVRDITERKRAEADRHNLQKLEALGLLAGGIAHDFNNLLAIILGNTSLALNNIKDEETRDYMIKTEQAVKQSIGLTKQLLTFAKGGAPVKKIGSIDNLLRDTTKFCLTGSNVLAEFYIDNPWLVEIDADQIGQVIQNIVINAKQAMPNGGKLYIRTQNIEEGDTKFLKVSIADSGIGVPKDHLDRIFDPYFTTKQSGSGLGLAVCHSIIQKHDGRILAESEMGVGTTIHISLPSIGKMEVESEIGQRDESYKIAGKILVMDDDKLITDVLVSMLKVSGHEVSTSNNGNEALTVYRQAMEAGSRFDLVIMDLTVPGGMGGKEAIKEILSIDPDARAIVSSGYSEDAIMANPSEYGFVGAISKPYDLKELNRVVSLILSSQ